MKDNKSGFFQDVQRVFGTKILIYVIGFVSSIYLARVLKPEGKGIYASAMAISGILSQFFNLGLHSSHTYHIAKDTRCTELCVGDCVIILVIGLVFSVLALPVLILSNHTLELDNYIFCISIILFPFMLFNMLEKNIFVAINRIRFYNLLELLNTSLLPIAVAVISSFSDISVSIVITTTLVTEIMIAFFSLVGFKVISRTKILFSCEFLKKILPYGLKTYISSMVTYLILKIDILMLNKLVSDAEIGLYSLAVNLSDLIFMVTSSVSLMLFPRLSSITEKDKKIKLFKKAFAYSLPVILGSALLMEILSGILIPLVYGMEYQGAIIIVRILTLAVVFWSFSSFGYNYLASENDLFPAIWIPAIVLLVNILLNALLIPIRGIKGAAEASLLSYFWNFAGIMLYILWKEKGHRYAS